MGNANCCKSAASESAEFVNVRSVKDGGALPVRALPSDCEKACADSGACYAIYWQYDAVSSTLHPVCHWNPPDRVAAMKQKTGSDELYTTESYKIQMKPGDGFVGRAYANHEAVFFADVSQLPVAEFKRKDLAARFGILSLALKPFMDGVMEVGATKQWDACCWIRTVSATDCEKAAKDAGASFAIFWGLCAEKGVLRPMCHWNPPERVAEVKAQTGSDELYTTESYKVELAPGVGLMGTVFRDKLPVFYPDVAQLSETEFKRKDLTTRFGIASLAFKPFEDGVMEVGCSKKWESCEWANAVSAEDCKWVAKEHNADFAIYWGFDAAQGALRPVSHWNPPERVAAVKAETGKDDLYTTESHQTLMKLGCGFVGKVYQDRQALFFSDVAELPASAFQRKDLAMKYKIRSLAFKPCRDGVLEMGTTQPWEKCEWVNTVTPLDCERAAKDAGASFAIYWGLDEGRGILRPMCHWNPPERVSEMKAQTGSDELYTTESYRFPLKPGDGFVGRAFKNQETRFFPDVSKLPEAEFRRLGLAKRFGISSLAFKPFANGVIEVGSAERWEKCAWAETVTVEDCQRVCKEAGASFAIYWGLDKAGDKLRPVCHWNPPERIAAIQAITGEDGLYTTESYKTEMKLGEGFVGKACENMETMFFPDVSTLSSEYRRRDIAARYGIASLALKPFGGGVYEVGSVKRWDSCEWLYAMSVDDCRRACLDAKGSFAIFWSLDEAKGALRPTCHWNPPERVAEVQARAGGDELYTTESYKVEMPLGEGFVGKVFKDKKAMSIEEVSKVSEADFKRKALAAKFGIESIMLLPFAKGVLEVGRAKPMITDGLVGA